MTQKIRLPNLNIVALIGRVIRDPELKYTQKGQAVCRFDIAVNRNYKDVTGNWQQETTYVPVVVWRDVAVRSSEKLKKGSPVQIIGRLQTRSWEDKDGKKHTAVEVAAQRIQFLEFEEAAEIPEMIETVESEQSGEIKPSDEDVPF